MEGIGISNMQLIHYSAVEEFNEISIDKSVTVERKNIYWPPKRQVWLGLDQENCDNYRIINNEGNVRVDALVGSETICGFCSWKVDEEKKTRICTTLFESCIENYTTLNHLVNGNAQCICNTNNLYLHLREPLNEDIVPMNSFAYSILKSQYPQIVIG